jgi:hypothetical protein
VLFTAVGGQWKRPAAIARLPWMRARKPVRLVPLDSHNVPSGRTTTISTSTVTTTTITTYMHAVQLRGGGDAPLAPRRMVRDDSRAPVRQYSRQDPDSSRQDPDSPTVPTVPSESLSTDNSDSDLTAVPTVRQCFPTVRMIHDCQPLSATVSLSADSSDSPTDRQFRQL